MGCKSLDCQLVRSVSSDSESVAQGGANAGLRAYGIGLIVSVGSTAAAKKGGKKGVKAASDSQLTVLRYYRPEDVSRDAAYTAAFTDVYQSDDSQVVDLDDVVGRCHVLPPGAPLTGLRLTQYEHQIRILTPMLDFDSEDELNGRQHLLS